MVKTIAIVLDCGATKLSATAFDSKGSIIKRISYANEPVAQPGGEVDWRIWDLDQIWQKLSHACLQVCASIDRSRIKAVTVCTFGADGAPVRKDGTLTYPVISWYDPRTRSLMKEIKELMHPWDIFVETGYQLIPFNTLLRLMWLRKHAPKALNDAEHWMMMPSLLSFKLCRVFSIEPTAAGTMMAMEQGKRDWSEKMLTLAKLDPSFFPKWVEPGAIIGHVHSEASRQTGLPNGIPVVATGHDTQFAAIGSGAQSGEAILSSGTWEILMLRINEFKPTRFGFDEGILIENDAIAGFWNPQLLMMASGVIEWVRRHFYADLTDLERAYAQMITDGRKIGAGSAGVMVLPSFIADTGPMKKFGTWGTILGLNINTERGHLYRATLEGLSFQLRHALSIIIQATGVKVKGVRVVGGGSKNELWNQIRADVIGLPVTTIAQKEATSLGAALFAFVGAGTFASIREAQANVAFEETVFEPSENRVIYEDLFAKYIQVPRALKGFYQPTV